MEEVGPLMILCTSGPLFEANGRRSVSDTSMEDRAEGEVISSPSSLWVRRPRLICDCAFDISTSVDIYLVKLGIADSLKEKGF